MRNQIITGIVIICIQLAVLGLCAKYLKPSVIHCSDGTIPKTFYYGLTGNKAVAFLGCDAILK